MLIYSVVIFLLQRKKTENKHFDSCLERLEFHPPIDIFIPVHNEQAIIIDTLESMLHLDYTNYRVLIIDDHSTDKTAVIVQDYIASNYLEQKVGLLSRLGENERRGKSASLNAALKESKADYILVCDADARLPVNCLKLSLPYFLLDEKTGAVQYQKRAVNFDHNTFTLCQDLEFAFDTYLQTGRDRLNGFVELRGSGQIASRKCLLDTGGWDEYTLTDDLELSTRIHIKGWNIRFAHEIVLEEEALIRHRAFWRQRRRWAEGSLRRYLAHFASLVLPWSGLSFIKRLDVLPFLSQFAVPFWFLLDLLVQILYFINGEPTYVPALVLAILGITSIMWINIIIAVYLWRDMTLWESVLKGSLTFMYGSFHWPTIVLWSIRKVLFGFRQTEWGKTPRMKEVNA